MLEAVSLKHHLIDPLHAHLHPGLQVALPGNANKRGLISVGLISHVRPEMGQAPLDDPIEPVGPLLNLVAPERGGNIVTLARGVGIQPSEKPLPFERNGTQLALRFDVRGA
ncbi:MAG TPA: hypothetical protein VIJ45_00385 [Coriobacteriia bacterium]|jgi:hypothetical protein